MVIKRFIKVSILLVLLAGISVFFYRYYLLNKTSPLSEHIPKDAETLVYLNIRTLWQEFDKNDTGINPQVWLKKSVYLSRVQDFKTSGIDLLSDAAYVEHNGNGYLLMLLDEPEKFEALIRESMADLFRIQTKKGEWSSIQSKKDSFVICWNNQVICYIPKKASANSVLIQNSLSTLKKETSFYANAIYTKVRNDKVPVWFYTADKRLKNQGIKPLKGNIHFENGIRVSASEDMATELSNSSSQMNLPDSVAYLYSDTSFKTINRLIRDIAVLHLGHYDDGISALDFNKIVKSLTIAGTVVKENKVISYHYDDNFNLSKEIVIQKDSIKACKLDYKYPGNPTYTSVYNTEKNLFIQPIEKDSHIICYLNFNQDVFKVLTTLNNKFHIEFWVSKNNDSKSMQLDLQVDNIFSLLNLLSP